MEQLGRFRHCRLVAQRAAVEELGQLVVVLCARTHGILSQFLGRTNRVFEHTAQIGAVFIGGPERACDFGCVGRWVRGGSCHVGYYLAKSRAMERALESAALSILQRLGPASSACCAP